MLLINCKVYLDLNWIEDCILPSAGDTSNFAVTDTKLHVPRVALSTKYSANLAKQLNKGFKSKPAKKQKKEKNIYELLNASFQSVKRLFVLAYFIANGGDDEAGIKKKKKSIFYQEKKLKITTY